MPRVYILNKGAHDYSQALQYGTPIYVTEGLLPKFNVNFMARKVEDVMSDSTPEDYILLTSLSTLCSIACAYYAAKHGRLNILLYKDDRYVVRKLVFDHEKVEAVNSKDRTEDSKGDDGPPWATGYKGARPILTTRHRKEAKKPGD